MPRPFVCPSCRQLTPERERVEERIEFRRVSDYSRFRVVKIGDLCLGCAQKRAEGFRPTPLRQASLWT